MSDDLKPLSRKTRRAYLGVFVFLFVLCLPIAILYATGYRFQNGLSLVETGGVYISVGPSDASVSLNGREIGISGFLNHSFYVDNLAPGSYAVHVARDGDYPWYKTLIVEPRIVTDAQAFLVPSEFIVRKLMVGSASSVQASTTVATTRLEYDAFLLHFAPTTTKPKAVVEDETLIPNDTQGGENLYLENGVVRLEWGRSTSTIPSSMCSTPSSCEKNVIIAKAKEKITRTNFYGGGVLYLVPSSGIFLAEIDVRPTPLVVPVYPRAGVDYRILNGRLIVKDGTALYEISGF